jgi:pilus assembly protein CpaF
MDVEKLYEQVLQRLDITQNLEEEQVNSAIEAVLDEMRRTHQLSVAKRHYLRKKLYYAICGYDILSELSENEDITEIMVNGYNKIFIEKKGRIEQTELVFTSEERLMTVISRIVSNVNRRVNESSPIVDARLPDGSRVNIVLPPVSIDGITLTIRRFPKERITMDKMITWGCITREAADFLKQLILAKYNVFICGGTGSGKTTFLNVLTDYIPEGERIISIEDSAELQISHIENLVRLETRLENEQGANGVTIRDLIKTALRMRPDRIIVGEVRGEEALDMLQAMLTGHDGSLSTGHADSPADMMTRLETMVLMGCNLPLDAIQRQIAAALDVVVFLGRMPDKSRGILEIAEVNKTVDTQVRLTPLFIRKESLVQVGKLSNQEKLKRYGI